VWYRYTPRRDREVVFDAVESDHDAYITVFTQTSDGLELYYDGCDSVASVSLKAGVTYAVMASTCCGEDASGGDLAFRARAALTSTVDVDAEGTVSQASGEATLTGTVTCNRRATSIQVAAYLRQRISDTALAYGEANVFGGACTPRAPLRFSVVVEPFGVVPFKAGNAGVRLLSSVCDGVSCGDSPDVREVVLLRWVA
jgi:hypothetical protein